MSRLSGNTKKVSVYGRKTHSRVVNRQTAFTVLNDDTDDPFGFFSSSQSRKEDDSVDTSLSFQSATSNISSYSSAAEIEEWTQPKTLPLQKSKVDNVGAVLNTPKASTTSKRLNADSPVTARKPRKTVAKAKAILTPTPPQESTPPPIAPAGRVPRRAAQAAKMAIEDYDFTDRDMTPRRPVPTKSYFVEKAKQIAEWAREDAAEEQSLAARQVSTEIPHTSKSDSVARKSSTMMPVSRSSRRDAASDTSASSIITASDLSTTADSSQSSYSQPTSDDSMLHAVKVKKYKGHAEKRFTRRIIETSDDEAENDSGSSSEDEDHTMQLVKSVGRMSIAPARVDADMERLTPGITDLLQTVSQSGPEAFDRLIARVRTSDTRKMRRIEKLGEASYSEVFKLVPASSADEALVMKVIPISMNVNGTHLDDEDLPDTSPARDVRQEVQIMQLLDAQSSSAFVSLRSAFVARGEYPAQLLKAWDRWDTKRHAKHGQGAENIRPCVFANTQLYAVLLMTDGGPDLESVRIKSWTQAAAVFWQVTAGLCEMEQKYIFEHRDLHWGNILVRTTEPTTASFTEPSTMWLDSSKSGVQTTIIDFTLSRATLPSDNRGNGKQRQVIAYSFEDDSIFQGQGDAQFEVYRQMRQVTQGEWSASHPLTNVLWLRYLVHKLIDDKCQRLRPPPTNAKDLDAKRELHSYRTLHDAAQTLDSGAVGKQAVAVSSRCSGTRNSATRKSLAPSAFRTSALTSTTPVQSAADLLKIIEQSAALQ